MPKNHETIYSSPEQDKTIESTNKGVHERQEQLDESRRERNETDHESIEQARKDIEKAHERETQPENNEKPSERKERLRATPTKRDKLVAYHKVMEEAERHMTPTERTFSRFIHHPTVEKVSETVGSTVARPNSILFGAMFAFLFTLGIYLVARSYGYVLSGGETIVSFAAGWLFGLLIDYIRLLVTGKRS